MNRWHILGAAFASGAAVVVTAVFIGSQVRSKADPLDTYPTGPATSDSRTLTEAEARAVLAARVQLLAKRDRVTYCGKDDPLCDAHWTRAGGNATVPKEPPRILGSRIADGVRVLMLCGRDGQGKLYQSDFPVDIEGGQPQPLLAVFWRNVHYSGDRPDDTPFTITPSVPAESPSAISCALQ